MLIIGLTGSIGMGKTAAAERFKDNGVPVFEADKEVHRLYEDTASPEIERAFPGTTENGRVNRKRLAKAVMDDPEALRRLEAIVHPLVREAEREFLARHAKQGAPMAVLEIPLLFETGADKWVDVTVVVSAPEAVQRERVLGRPGMTKDKLDALLDNQLPDREKRARADFVVETDRPREETQAEIDRLIESLRKREGTAINLWLEESD